MILMKLQEIDDVVVFVVDFEAVMGNDDAVVIESEM